MTLAAGGSVSAAPTPVHPEGNSELRPNGHSSAMNPPPMAGGAVGMGSRSMPGDVIVIAVLLFVSAAFSLVVGGLMVMGIMAAGAMMAQSSAELAQAGITSKEAGAVAGVGAIVMIIACIPLVIGAGQLTVGVGMLKMKKWAWYGAFGLAVLTILSSLARFNIFSFVAISINGYVIKALIQTREAFE
ncbi:MAG: hypothetical protein HC860_04535 [Alkalinema sp. RU_4_3]|nr:hypothetical protein [Alkalinema sp. RU_4_3]